MVYEKIKEPTILAEQSSETLKKIVRDKYSDIARSAPGANPGGCCGTSQTLYYSMMNESYEGRDGYNPDADLALGCGIPTDIANIQEGDVVLDLGSGAGNDVFVARSLTGPKGWVIGVDMTEEMIEKARANNQKLGFSNVEFRLGDIENLPVQDNEISVVISNCVLNLVPNKHKAFSEIYRVLKPGGHFSISDIVSTGDLPPAVQRAAELYAGCVAGAIDRDAYLNIVHTTGFFNVRAAKEREIDVPDEVLANVLSADELQEFRASGAKILSITVYAEKKIDKPLPNAIQ